MDIDISYATKLQSPIPKPYHNLPQPDYGQFVGREKELAQIMRLLRPYPLSRHHLIVIDGVGGIGKSTLALEVAHRCLQFSRETAEPDKESSHLSKIRRILVDRFSEEELKTLCFDMALDYDMLPGDSKGGKSRELVAYLERRNRLAEFVEEIQKSRPDVVVDSTLSKPAPLNQIAEKFEAIIWVSAKSDILTTEGIVPRRQAIYTLDDIYTTISIALEREDIIRADVDNQDEIVRRTLSRQRTLLIVDNLETVADPAVVDFLRELPAPTKAIVTTRHRIDIAYAVRLTGMSWQEAHLLIQKEGEEKGIQLNESQAKKLFDRTGGVPIALVWCIAQIGNGYTVRSILTKLGQPHSNITKFIFENSLIAINNSIAETILLAIAQFHTGATQDALRYVANIPELDFFDGLAQLQKLSLVNQSHDRYDILPLTRQYLSNQMVGTDSVRRTIQECWLNYLLALTEENKRFGQQSSARLTPEIENIKGAINWCWQNKRYDLIGFVNNMAYYLHGNGYWNHLEKYLQWGIDISVLYEEEAPQARFYYLWANVNQYRGELDLASKQVHRAISISEATGQTHRLALSINRLGLIERRKAHYESAKTYFQESMAFAKDSEHRGLMNRNYLCLSVVAIEQGDFGKAHNLLAKCVGLEEQTIWEAAWWYRQQGQVATFNQEYEQAEWLLQRSLDIAEAIPMQQNVAEALFSQAELFLAMNRHELARTKAQQARELFEMLNMNPQLPRTKALIQEIENAEQGKS